MVVSRLSGPMIKKVDKVFIIKQLLGSFTVCAEWPPSALLQEILWLSDGKALHEHVFNLHWKKWGRSLTHQFRMCIRETWSCGRHPKLYLWNQALNCVLLSQWLHWDQRGIFLLCLFCFPLHMQNSSKDFFSIMLEVSASDRCWTTKHISSYSQNSHKALIWYAV